MILTAVQPPEVRRRTLSHRKLVPGEIAMNTWEFDARIAEIRKTGHLASESQTTVGVVNLSCPILVPFGNAAAALTCPYLRGIDGYSTPDRNRVLALLAETVAETSLQVLEPAHERTLV